MDKIKSINTIFSFQFKSVVVGIVVFLLFFPQIGCNQKTKEKNGKPELLIYCGITMIDAVSDISEYVEK